MSPRTTCLTLRSVLLDLRGVRLVGGLGTGMLEATTKGCVHCSCNAESREKLQPGERRDAVHGNAPHMSFEGLKGAELD